jgi:hypothetical protein
MSSTTKPLAFAADAVGCGESNLTHCVKKEFLKLSKTESRKGGFLNHDGTDATAVALRKEYL